MPAGGLPGILPVRSVPDLAGEPGAHAQAVPLRWIAAAEMQAILAAVAPRDVILRADKTRNVLILSGDRAQIQALRETIAVFDVDWMSGMSTAMIPVRSANSAAMARDLVQIFDGETAGTGDIIRFVPNEALGAIQVVSARRLSRPGACLDRAPGDHGGRARAPAFRLPHPEPLGPRTRRRAAGRGRRRDRGERRHQQQLRRLWGGRTRASETFGATPCTSHRHPPAFRVSQNPPWRRSLHGPRQPSPAASRIARG